MKLWIIVNMGAQISLQHSFQFFWMYAHKWNYRITWWFYFHFLKNRRIVSHRGCAILPPTNTAQGFQFLHFLPTTYFLFGSSSLNGYEVVSRCSFDLPFFNVGLEEVQAGIKIARKNINHLRYEDWHHPYGRKWRGTKKPLDESERGEWKSWLKAQHSEN